ncbi:MAG: DUF4292 domain-containing protein [Deltaproteobacteria bacterium]|nr:DUF4292 domain-containing protein [Deltaproteobacteria bacterium]
MKKLAYIVLFTLMAFVFADCAPQKPVEPIKRYIPPPEDVLKKISMTSNGKEAMTATARITIKTAKSTYSQNVAIAVKKPASLRIETIPLFGTPDLLLSVDVHRLKVFLPKEGHFYVGPATRQNIFLFSRLFLNIDEAVAILMGTPPLLQQTGMVLKGSMEKDLYRINIFTGERLIQSLWIDLDQGKVLQTDVFNETGEIYYRVEFDDYNLFGRINRPQLVKIIIAEPQKISASIKYSNIQVLSQTGENLFDLPVPPGIMPITIE